MSINTFSRVWKEDKYDWDIVSNEEYIAINTIVNNYNTRI